MCNVRSAQAPDGFASTAGKGCTSCNIQRTKRGATVACAELHHMSKLRFCKNPARDLLFFCHSAIGQFGAISTHLQLQHGQLEALC